MRLFSAFWVTILLAFLELFDGQVGLAEAEAAGHRLAADGCRFDEAHVSVLQRTRQTAEAVLSALGQSEVPIHETWRLNERQPATESLADCQRRMLPYWNEVLVPRIRSGRRLLVVSHGNTLRSLMMHLDRIGPVAMEKVEVPSGVPLVYRLSDELEVLGRAWLG